VSKFQLLGAVIDIGSDRDNTVVRDKFDPITYPELLILRAIHGGEEHVHSVVAVGYAERENKHEIERLSIKYGERLVRGLFPGALTMLPLEDPAFPTEEEVVEGEHAAKQARSRVRAKKAEDAPVVPKVTSGKMPDLTK